MDKIFIEGLEVFGHHGVYEEERKLGQRFLIDVEIACDLRKSGQSDDLNDTLDYARVLSIVREEVEGQPRHLLECLAENIAQRVLQDERAQVVRILVRKPHVALPASFQNFGVEITRHRV